MQITEFDMFATIGFSVISLLVGYECSQHALKRSAKKDELKRKLKLDEKHELVEHQPNIITASAAVVVVAITFYLCPGLLAWGPPTALGIGVGWGYWRHLGAGERAERDAQITALQQALKSALSADPNGATVDITDFQEKITARFAFNCQKGGLKVVRGKDLKTGKSFLHITQKVHEEY